MEKTAKKTKKTVSEKQFKTAFIEHVLLNGHEPSSVFAFASSLNTTEARFYTFFNSFKSLERSIWADWLKDTIKIIEKDPAYAEYTVREKLLAFYYTWLETLKQHRSYVLKAFEGTNSRDINPGFLDTLKVSFKHYINDLLMEGKDTTEVMERPFSDQYEKAFWFHFVFITRFWVEDDSKDFEKTDAAIEKSVNLAFDLVGKGPVDSILDFGKFLFQNRMPFK